MSNLPTGIPVLKDDFTGLDAAVTIDGTDVDPIVAAINDHATNINQLAAASSASFDFATDPGIMQVVVNNPTGAESLDASVPLGKYRLTAPATVTDGNFRALFPVGKSGYMGDSEVRSTWSALSTALSDSHGRFQPGHSHRVAPNKQVVQRGSATSGAGTTISNSGAPWSSNQFAGVNAFQVQHYVTLIGGTGIGQTRRIVSNTTIAITVDSAWDTNPAAGSIYEIWSYNVRAVTWTKNIAFNAHAILNCHVWDGCAFNPVGQVDLGAYLKPGGVYVQFPWTVKTKVVGRTASIIVTKSGDVDVAYGTAGRGTSVTLPAGWDQAGMSGFYLGHLQANDWAEFDNPQIVRL